MEKANTRAIIIQGSAHPSRKKKRQLWRCCRTLERVN